jgi:transposase-like protein
MTTISDPVFQNEDKARAWLEASRWPDGVVCPFCGQLESSSAQPAEGALGAGWYHCRDCRKKFTVRVGTLYARSHIPLHKWLLATHLLCASKKGMSAHQLARMLEITYKSAWFMAHRIREGMAPLKSSPLGGEGKIVEADTTYIGGKEKNKHRNKRTAGNIGGKGKMIAHTLVERGGRARSDHIANVAGKTLRPIVMKQVSRKSSFMTDTAGGYMEMGKEFARHEMVDHGAGEYVRGDAHSNTVEGYFATLKRGITGVYHHVSEAHLKRYLAEFDFRYNERMALGVDDTQRMEKAVKGIEGKRLTYRRTDSAQESL